MAATGLSTILAEETERTKGNSRTQIKQFIVESDSKITSIQNEIAALESRIAALVKLRDRECAAGAALRFLIAPIRTLPVELLAEIFALTIHESDSDDFPHLWAGPVHVSFSRQPGYDWESYIGVHIFISGLRIGSWLDQSGSRMMPRSLLQGLAGCRLDSLEELGLPFVIPDVPDVDLTTMFTFTTAPRLRAFSNKTASQDLRLEIFSQYTNLVRASLTSTGWSGLPPAKPDVLALGHLRVLSVS
ncbi:hypothetical protein C8R45DRAFT_1214040 [Mycena sanguinolenta]|nr:hypothetical protein C8R45DRAFT_1214040 [Mycena sanguinolenta]